MSGDERRDAEAERWDELVSADLDHALSPEERAALADRLARDASLAARAARFRRIDDALRSLAGEPLDDAELETGWARLRSRLALASEARGPGIGARRWPVGVAVAAAAALAVALLLSRSDRGVESPTPGDAPTRVATTASGHRALETPGDPPLEASGDRPPEASAGRPVETLDAPVALDALESELGDELVLAIGYGDELSEVGSIPNEDFEVIERLELLDFLLEQSSEGQG
jgi:anti-sigma factor RsiW